MAANDLNLFASVFDNLLTYKQFDSKGLTIDSLSTEEAYQVQRLVVQNRCQRGERAVGFKIGCTSAPIRKQFGLSEPICGRVMEPHVEYGSTELETNNYLEPAIEPEFVLTIGKDITAMPESDEQLLDCIDYVSPGIELHHFKFHFGDPTLQELIASNGIHAGLVMGQERFAPRQVDWQMEGVGVFRGNDLIASGIAADILGGPLKSLRWLIGHLVAQGSGLKAGDIVIPGSAVELVRVNVGDRITARFTHAGSVTATFV